MKTTSGSKLATQSESATKTTAAAPNFKIHPVIVYPCKPPGNYSNLRPLASALIQIERIEWVLKHFWLERHQQMPGLVENFRVLETQSEQVRRTAQVLLQNALG